MRVFGFNEDMEVFPVELTFQDFARSGIHPLRIDLMEPQSIERTFDGRKLKFSPLRTLAFAFPSIDGRYIVAMHDGEEKCCITGDRQEDDDRLILSNCTVVERSFEDCLREYMEVYSASGKSELPEHFLDPLPASCVQMSGSQVVVKMQIGTFMSSLEESGYLGIQPTYRGVMLHPWEVKVELPEEIRWIFDTFSRYEPIVYGSAFREMINNAGIRCVDVLVGDCRAFTIEVAKYFCPVSETNLGNMDVHVFTRNGVLYRILPYYNGNRWISQYLTSRLDLATVDSLYCADGETVRGRRIAFSDIGSMQARFLLNFETDNEVDRALKAQNKQALSDAGYKLFEFGS